MMIKVENIAWNSMFGRAVDIIKKDFESRGGEKRW